MEQQPQIYGATLKAFFGDEVADILPVLIPGAEFISECNIEIDRTIINQCISQYLCVKQNIMQEEKTLMIKVELRERSDYLLYRKWVRTSLLYIQIGS